MRTTTIQIARILRGALDSEDLARVAEGLECYLIASDDRAGRGPANPTEARRAEVASGLLDRIEAHLRDDEAAPADDDPAPGASDDTPAPPEDQLADALRRVDECLDRAEGAAERLRGEDGRCVREALDDASEIVARALKGATR